jgi:hypothetical protein
VVMHSRGIENYCRSWRWWWERGRGGGGHNWPALILLLQLGGSRGIGCRIRRLSMMRSCSRNGLSRGGSSWQHALPPVNLGEQMNLSSPEEIVPEFPSIGYQFLKSLQSAPETTAWSDASHVKELIAPCVILGWSLATNHIYYLRIAWSTTRVDWLIQNSSL